MNKNVEEIVLRLRDQMSKGLIGAGRNMDKLRDKTDKETNSLKKLRTQAIAAFAAYGVGRAIKGVANLGVQMEQTRISFSTFLGDAEKANKLIEDLNQFSNVTPFTNDQVLKSSRSLLAYNVEAEKLIPTLNSLGNIAAGVGTDKLPNLILAFGQVKAATRLTGMELRQFTEAGVPLLDELSKMMKKPVSVIKEELIPAGKIGFPLVEQAMKNLSMEGGRFFNLMEKQSKSVGGLVSTLKGQLQSVGFAIGEALVPTMQKVALKLKLFTEWALKNRETIASWVPAIVKVVGVFGSVIAAIKIWTGVQWLLNAAMTANPIGIVIVAIGGLIAVMTIIFKKMNDGTRVGKALYNAFLLVTFPIRMQIKLIKSLIDYFIDLYKKGTWVTAVVDEMRRHFMLLKAAGNLVIDFFAELPNHALSAFDVIKTRLKSFVDLAVGAFKILTNPFDQAGRNKGIAQFKKGVDGMQKNALDIYVKSFKERKAKEKAEEERLTAQASREGAAAGSLSKGTGLGNLLPSSKNKTGQLQAGLSSVTSTAPKNVTISIDKLIEKFEIQTTNIKEGADQVKEMVQKTLLTALNDAQIQGGQ